MKVQNDEGPAHRMSKQMSLYFSCTREIVCQCHRKLWWNESSSKIVTKNYDGMKYDVKLSPKTMLECEIVHWKLWWNELWGELRGKTIKWLATWFKKTQNVLNNNMQIICEGAIILFCIWILLYNFIESFPFENLDCLPPEQQPVKSGFTQLR